MVIVECAHLALRQPRVQLHLIQNRNDAGLIDQPLQVVDVEVRHADRPDHAIRLELLQRTPGLNVLILLRRGPVDEVQVDVVER